MNATNETFPRFELSGNENVTLICSTICAGRFIEIGMDEPQAVNWLGHFFRAVRGERSETLKSLYLMMQNLLMAQRKGDFLSIQLQPPFTRFSLVNAQYMATALAERDDAGLRAAWNEVFAPGFRQREPEHVIVTYDGGPGDSAENALRLFAADANTSVAAEYWWLFYTFGRDWKLGLQHKDDPHPDGRYFDRMEVVLPDNQRHWAWFDITERVVHSKPQ